MSLSKPAAPMNRNPATKYIEWKGADDQGFFQYYDKTVDNPQERNIIVDLSEGFLVLDGIDQNLFSITGYDERNKCNLVSNEVRSLDDVIIVKKYIDGKAEIVLQGTYNALKETVKDNKMYDYTKCMYIFFQGELCHLKLKGAPLRQWFTDVQPNLKASRSWIHVASVEDGIQGKVKYKYPKWAVGEEVDQETMDLAIECDRDVLQPYLDSYLKPSSGSSNSQGPPPEQHEQVDTSQWRKAKTMTGVLLCDLNMNELYELQDTLISDHATGPLVDYVGHAIFDYQAAGKIWKDQVSRANGKYLADFTHAELVEALKKVPAAHPAKLYLEHAEIAKRPTMTTADHSFPDFDDDEEEIPF